MFGTRRKDFYHFYFICCLTGIIRKVDSFYCKDHDGDIGLSIVCNGIPDCADGSDEENCGSSGNLSLKTFRCADGEFIEAHKFCDDNYDCHDQSDEGYGCDYNRCHSEHFTCDNGDCTSVKNRCNGVSDCSDDGSDENYCDHELGLTDCTISQGKFLCKDELRCIELNYTCDGYFNCFDGSDETDECNNYNSTEYCFHARIKTPEGPHCFYNSGTNTMEAASKDLSDCDFSSSYCSQKCSMYGNRQYCDCEENYLYNSTINECIEQDKNSDILLYTTFANKIKVLSSYTKQTKTIMVLEYSELITAISAANGYVYWCGIYNGSTEIGRVSLQGGEKEILIITDDIANIDVMDVDWRTGNIYFFDNKRKRLTICTEKKICFEIHEINDFVGAVRLAPRFGYMFFSTFNGHGGYSIIKSDMNGENQYPIVTEGISFVFSISVDETTKTLYWCDHLNHEIEEIHFSGSNRRILHSNSKKSYIAVAVNPANIYYTSLESEDSIECFQQSRNPSFPPIIQDTSTIEDDFLLIYGFSNTNKTSKLTPPCNWGCDGICLITPNPINRTRSYCINKNNSTILRAVYNLKENRPEIDSTLTKSNIPKTTSAYYPTKTQSTTKEQDFNDTSIRHHDNSSVTVPNFVNRTDHMLNSLHQNDNANVSHVECSGQSNSTFNIIIGFTTFLVLLNIIAVLVVVYSHWDKLIRILGNRNKQVSNSLDVDLELS